MPAMHAKQWAISITTSALHVAPVVRKLYTLILPSGRLSDLLLALIFCCSIGTRNSVVEET